jgi:serine protease Do
MRIVEKRQTRILMAGLALSLILPAWGAVTTATQAAPPAVKGKLWTSKANVAPISPNAPVAMNRFSQLAKALRPAVINIHVVKRGGHLPSRGFGHGREFKRRTRGVGSGFIIHPDGYALTNYHVVRGATRIEVKTVSNETYSASVVGSYPKLDVALLKIKTSKKLPVAALGDSDKLEIAEWVLAIGNPFGLNHTVTAGIVSAKGRTAVQPGRQMMHANFIQTDASINPGNSGGPLINTRGQVVGINTAINRAGQGIGFAVPINMVKKILPQLSTGNLQRSYLGVKIGVVSARLAQSLGMPQPVGALVSEVMPGTPAARAGLRPGDVITHWGQHLIKGPSDLSWQASTHGVNVPVKVMVRRQQRVLTLSLRLTHYPGQGAVVGLKRNGAVKKGVAVKSIGLAVRKLDAAASRQLQLRGASAVLVTHVRPSSRAGAVGIRSGDVILQVNYRPIMGTRAFKKAIAQIQKGDLVSFIIQRGQRRLFLAFSK